MAEFIMAAQNGRNIPTEDKIFGISRRANEMINEKGPDAVVNATIGTLLDDDGDLMVLSSVDDTYMGLEPEEYAAYAPIGGTPAYKKAAIKAALGKYEPKGYVEAVATPGGTGSIRNTIANYSCPGDKVLTSDWHWAPYRTITSEIGRSIDTYQLFTEDGQFNIEAFSKKVHEILEIQDRLVIIINTPAHNPTGYALSNEDWQQVVDCLSYVAPENRIAQLFCGEIHQNLRRQIGVSLTRCALQAVPQASGQPKRRVGFNAHALRNRICCFKPNAEYIFGQSVRIFAHHRHAIRPVLFGDTDRLTHGHAVFAQTRDYLAQFHILHIGRANLFGRNETNPRHLFEPVRGILQNIRRLFTEFLHNGMRIHWPAATN